MMQKYRTILYIDGFNLYHAIDELNQPDLKWLNLWALGESLLRKNEVLETVKYFSAYATWMPNSYKVHRDYTKALQAEGVELVFGNFKDKFCKCKKCGRTYKTKEEKETDVNLALHMVTDGMLDKYDRAIMVSADSDMVAGVEMARHLTPGKEIFVVAPPGRFSRARALKPNLELKQNRLRSCLLAAEYRDDNNNVTVTRPSKYDPAP